MNHGHPGDGAGEGDWLRRRSWLRRYASGLSRRLTAEAVPFALARDGVACVRGTVSTLEGAGDVLLTAPLSGARCAAYELTLALFRRHVLPDFYLRFARGISFRLHDGQGWGHVAIDPPDLQVDLQPDPHAREPHEAAPRVPRTDFHLAVRVRPQTQRVYLPRRERDPEIEVLVLRYASWPARHFRRIELREGRVTCGDGIKVLGVGRWEPHPHGARASSRGAPLLYVLRAEDGELLLDDL